MQTKEISFGIALWAALALLLLIKLECSESPFRSNH
jgi:hypothetical protein